MSGVPGACTRATTLRRLAIPASVAVVAAVAIPGASPATDPSDDAAATRAMIAVRTGLTKVDVDSSHRDSPGDLLVFEFELWNAAETKKVGGAHAVCTMVRASGTELTAHCVNTAVLADGTIESSGLLQQPATTARFAVTGGTARYDEADGQVTLTALNELATRLRFDLELDP